MIDRNVRGRAVVALSCFMSSICLTVSVYAREKELDITSLNIILKTERIQGKAESVVFPQNLISSMHVFVCI